MNRILLGFLVVALAYPLLALLTGGQFGAGGALAVATFTVPVTVLLGWPAFAFFKRRGWLKWWQFGMGGLTVGAVCTLPFIIGVTETNAPLSTFTFIVLFFAALGAIHSIAFWAIAIWRNNDLTLQSSGTGR